MAFKISEFIDTVGTHGTLQTNKFTVAIEDKLLANGTTMFQTMKQNNNASAFDQSSFYDGYLLHPLRAESCRLPGMMIDTIETRRYGVGPQIKTGTNARFEPFSASFLIDKDFALYKFFYGWLNTVFNFGNDLNGNKPAQFMAEYKDLYATAVFVSVYENSGVMKNTYQFEDAFPVSVSDPALSWRDSNTPYKFDVTFAYTNWTMDNRPTNP